MQHVVHAVERVDVLLGGRPVHTRNVVDGTVSFNVGMSPSPQATRLEARGFDMGLMENSLPENVITTTIDAHGMVVAPGFIDMLGQSEMTILVDPRLPSKIFQGITTEITGEGSSIAPTNDRARSGSMDFYTTFHIVPDWLTLDEYFERMMKQGMGVNLGTYVGAGQVRKMVIGSENRPATPEELKTMQEIVEDAMGDGAMGVSSHDHKDVEIEAALACIRRLSLQHGIQQPQR